MTAAILVIGNEILSAKITDLNSNYLIKELRTLGVTVGGVFILPDDEKSIASLLKRIHPLFDTIFTTGGIGPTHDDVTIAGIARGFKSCLKRNEEYEKLIEKFFETEVKESVLKMAELPEETELIKADETIIPVIKIRNCFVLPGYPPLFEKQFQAIRDQFKSEPFQTKTVYLTIGEEEISSILEQADHLYSEVQVGSYPDYRHKNYKNKVVIDSKNEELNQKVLDFLLERIPKQFIFKVE